MTEDALKYTNLLFLAQLTFVLMTWLTFVLMTWLKPKQTYYFRISCSVSIRVAIFDC